MILNVPIFGQRDPRWANKPLGSSTSTLGGYGCLVTCLAMMAKYYGKDTDPDRLNTALKNINGFANGNLYKWYEGITKLYTDIKITKLQATPLPLTSTDFNAIKAEIDAGRPVILQVDFIPATSTVDMHFVLVVGYEGDTIYVNDPWYGDKANLTRYGDPKITVQQYIFHSGPVPAPGSSDTIPVLKTDFERLVTKATALDNQNPTYDQVKQIVQEINNQLDGLKKENEARIQFLQKIATILNCPASNEAVIGAITSIVSCETDLSSCRKDKEQLQRDLDAANATIITKEKERKDAVDQVLPLTNENIELDKQNTALTLERDKYKEKYQSLYDKRGTPGIFTKKELSNYLFKNWFNSKAFAKEK